MKELNKLQPLNTGKEIDNKIKINNYKLTKIQKYTNNTKLNSKNLFSYFRTSS